MAKTYTTVQGDMWDSIAYAQLGSTAYTDQLIMANLPEVEEPVSGTLPPWKQVDT